MTMLGWIGIAFIWGACIGGMIGASERRRKERNRHSANVNGSKKRNLYIESITEKR